MLILQYKVSLLSIDLVAAFVLFIFMLVYCCVFVQLGAYRFSVKKDLYNVRVRVNVPLREQSARIIRVIVKLPLAYMFKKFLTFKRVSV